MKSETKNKIIRQFRIRHRDWGFLMVGMCLVYAISGILLNHMHGKDPAFKTVEKTITLPAELTTDELRVVWKDKGESVPVLKKVFTIDENHSRLMLESGVGVYNHATGVVEYEQHKKNSFVYWINKLHYNKIKGWHIMADLFAISLIFFAITGVFMVKGSKGIAGRGKWFLIAGLLIPVIFVILA